MPNHHEQNPSTRSAPDATGNDAPEKQKHAVLSLTERLYARAEANGTVTAIDKLRHLHTIGDEAHLSDYIEDLVYEALDHDEQFIENMNQLKLIRARGGSKQEDEEKEIRTKQSTIFNEYKQEIVTLAGLPSEVGQDDYKIAQEKAQKVIIDHFKNGGEKDNVLEALGIVTTDDEGQEIFTFPNDLMPAETNKKWILYLNRVREHLRVKRNVEAGTGISLPAELESADKMRVLAHNAVTRDVHAILDLDKLVDGSWTFMNTRNLIAKMRDSRYPTVETAVKDRTAEGVMKASTALGILGTWLSDLR